MKLRVDKRADFVWVRGSGGVMFIVPMRVKPWSNARGHHMTKHKAVKAERQATAAYLREATAGDRKLVRFVRFTRIAPRLLDAGDNYPTCFKPMRDEIAAYYGVDDGPKGPITWEYAPQLQRPYYGVQVEMFYDAAQAHAVVP